MVSLSDNLARVRQRIEQVCRRCGRHPSSITLVGVTKGVSPEAIREAIALGLSDLGENRVQEARQKQDALGSRLKAQGTGFEPPASSLQPVRWHLIGHLQRNKAKDAVELFEAIHSVDSLPLVEELEKARGSRLEAQGKSRDKVLEVFIQVNVSGEKTKFGCTPEEASVLAHAIIERPQLKLRGLMTIAPFSEVPDAARPHFRRLREIRDGVAAALSLQPSALSLSMGMSHDFEVAIEEGADIVRIGTAIFGARGTRNSEFGIRSSE